LHYKVLFDKKFTMTNTKKLSASSLNLAAFTKPMLLGAGIALALIILFLAGVDEPDPAWPRFWMLRPLLIVPMAGAAGGAFFALLRPWHARGGWITVLAYVLSLLVFIIGLWLGTVLGLDGTLWN
jgi:hypothetical protein